VRLDVVSSTTVEHTGNIGEKVLNGVDIVRDFTLTLSFHDQLLKMIFQSRRGLHDKRSHLNDRPNFLDAVATVGDVSREQSVRFPGECICFQYATSNH
jgi:hypothetical protein